VRLLVQLLLLPAVPLLLAVAIALAGRRHFGA
jgi:hypothetical protein